MKHEYFTETVRLGKKGQITIPKQIRDEDRLREDDYFIVSHTPGGNIILTKQTVKTPEDLMLEIVMRSPPFDWRAVWEEIKKERKLEK